MSLLRDEKRAQRRAEKAAAKVQAENVPAGEGAEATAATTTEEPPVQKNRWAERLSSPRAVAWMLNLALMGYLGYAWGYRSWTDFEDDKIAQEVAYRVSRFTGEVSYLERFQHTQASFQLPVGEAPYLMRGELHLLWEEPPRDDIAFLWQNDHFARQRGVVVVSTDRDLLQSVDAILDDGDLGNGAAQMHPRGLWVSLK